MQNILKKIKEKGIRQAFRLIFVKLKKKGALRTPKLSEDRRRAVTALFGKEYKQVILFENHLGYYNIMLQRPQHLTRKLCGSETLVLYNSYYDIDFTTKERITKLDEDFYVLDMFYYREFLKSYFREHNLRKYLMVYSTDTVSLEDVKQYQKEGFDVIYEYVDDINPDLIFPQNLDNILRRHEFLIADRRTYVVTTATKLYQNVCGQNPAARTVLICNGVECEMFSPQKRTDDEEYLRWLKKDCIKVGYYGAMASWVDYDLLGRLAEDERMQLILIGVTHDNSLYESGLLDRENVRFFGKIAYDKLAGYANFFDVCMIPFVLNEITEATSPVKLFEYMSLQKPIVTTALPECKKYDVVYVADTHEQFCKMVYEADSVKNDESYKERLRTCAQENSWESRAEQMKAFLRE